MKNRPCLLIDCEETDVVKVICNISYFSEEKKMINLMVCDLFVFLNIKNNPKVNSLFHTPRPGAGFTVGFGGWGCYKDCGGGTL